MIVALIFDVDGTLAETEEAHRVSFNAAFVEAGLDWVWSQSDYRNLLRITGGKERMRHYIESWGLLRRQANATTPSTLCTGGRRSFMRRTLPPVTCRFDLESKRFCELPVITGSD